MKKLYSLAILLTCTVLASGCFGHLATNVSEDEPLCWGNINAKSGESEINTGLALLFVWLDHDPAAATLNPDCYSNKSDSNQSDTSDSNPSDTSDDSNPASSTDKDIEQMLNWQPPQAEKK